MGFLCSFGCVGARKLKAEQANLAEQRQSFRNLSGQKFMKKHVQYVVSTKEHQCEHHVPSCYFAIIIFILHTSTHTPTQFRGTPYAHPMDMHTPTPIHTANIVHSCASEQFVTPLKFKTNHTGWSAWSTIRKMLFCVCCKRVHFADTSLWTYSVRSPTQTTNANTQAGPPKLAPPSKKRDERKRKRKKGKRETLVEIL